MRSPKRSFALPADAVAPAGGRVLTVGVEPNSALFVLLAAQAQSACAAAQTLDTLLGDPGRSLLYLRVLAQIERDADVVAQRLEETTATALPDAPDTADIDGLTTQIAGIIGSIGCAASRADASRLPKTHPELQSLVALLIVCTQQTRELMHALPHHSNRETLALRVAGIHLLRRRSEKVYRQAVTRLCAEESIDARLLALSREVYERIEEAIARCEAVAGSVEHLMTRYTHYH